MSGPDEPGSRQLEAEWEFPSVEPADPASITLPDPPAPPAQASYDTGSDRWWERQAAPPAPTPLDAAWLPDELAHENGTDPDTDELALPLLPPPAPVSDAAAAEVAEPGPRAVPLEAWYDAVGGGPTEGRAARPAAPEQRVGPARALAGAGIALAGVCLGIGALLWLNGSDDSPHGSPTVALPRTPPSTAAQQTPATGGPVPSAPAVTSPPPVVVPPQGPTVLPVTVLNNSRYAGLADRAAARFRAAGWATPVVGNFRGRLRESTVYFSPGQEAVARRFAAQFGIARVLPRFDGLPGSGLTVVLTRDFA